MSGGHFDYMQYRIDQAADDVLGFIQRVESGVADEFGYKPEYSQATLEKMRETVAALKRAAAMLQRVDWLVCGDDGEESFHHRWQGEVPK